MLKKSLLLLVIPLLSFAAAHKFYLSVTDIEYSEKDKSLQIITKVFIDDMEDALKEGHIDHNHLQHERQGDSAQERSV